MPRFVLLYHRCPSGAPRESHWDFMLESEGVLRTWALSEISDFFDREKSVLFDEAEEGLKGSASKPCQAVQLADHRLAYLDYEGEISEGRGTVTRWDQGGYAVVSEGEGRLVLQLYGETLQGCATLAQSEQTPIDWLFTFKEKAR